jgi:hypothetical protein
MRLLEPRLVGQPFEVVAYDLTHLPQTWDADTFATAAEGIELTEARFAALLEAAGLP